MSQTERIRQVLDLGREQLNIMETPSYDKSEEIARILNLPPDYVRGEGIFSKWDQILRYYDYVSLKLRSIIPASMEMPSFCGEKLLDAWLDWTRYFPPEEVEFRRANWFAFAVADIQITPIDSDDEWADDERQADVKVTFTPEFTALMNIAKEQEEAMGPIRPISTEEMFHELAFQAGFDSDLRQ